MSEGREGSKGEGGAWKCWGRGGIRRSCVTQVQAQAAYEVRVVYVVAAAALAVRRANLVHRLVVDALHGHQRVHVLLPHGKRFRPDQPSHCSSTSRHGVPDAVA